MKKIHSVLLPFQNQFYLLPMLALSEVLPSFSYLPLETKGTQPDFLLGKIPWREVSLPLVSINLASVNLTKLKRPRIAIVNALFASYKYPPYFAVPLERAPMRISITENDIQWQDPQQASIKGLQYAALKKEVFLVDLFQLSTTIEKDCLNAL